MGKLVAVPVHSDVIFKRNLKWSDDTSLFAFYLPECLYACAYKLLIICMFQTLKEKDRSD